MRITEFLITAHKELIKFPHHTTLFHHDRHIMMKREMMDIAYNKLIFC